MNPKGIDQAYLEHVNGLSITNLRSIIQRRPALFVGVIDWFVGICDEELKHFLVADAYRGDDACARWPDMCLKMAKYILLTSCFARVKETARGHVGEVIVVFRLA